MTIDSIVASINISVYGNSNTYATCRSTSVGTLAGLYVGQQKAETPYYVYRAFLKFDTSTIPDDATISQVNLKLTCDDDSSGADFDVQIIEQDWSAQDPIAAGTREAAYDNCLAAASSFLWRNTNGMSNATVYTSANLTTGYVSKTGSTYYSLRSKQDKDNAAPAATEYVLFRLRDHATVSNRPTLAVTYTVPVTFVPSAWIL